MNNLKLAILASIAALPFEVVAVPEFGNDPNTGKPFELRVSVMSGAQRDAFESHWRDVSKSNENLTNMGFGVCLLIHCVVDTEGVPVFGMNDFSQLMQLNSVVLSRLTKKAFAVNKILTDTVEDAEKNS